jgi:hypothetical protein
MAIMLPPADVPSRGKPHDYPKMILSNLLILEYWRTTGHYTLDMMSESTAIANEERGEIMFSLLGRCVQGDPMKSDFEHMNSMFKLLPVYRDVKKDILFEGDQNEENKQSITWHHKVPLNSPEVAATSFFFNRLIDDITAGRYLSYDETQRSYRSGAIAATAKTTAHMPIIFIADVTPLLEPILVSLQRALNVPFVRENHHIFPPIDEDKDDHSDLDNEEEKRDGMYGPPWDECVVGRYAVTRTEFPGIVLLLDQKKTPSTNGGWATTATIHRKRSYLRGPKYHKPMPYCGLELQPSSPSSDRGQLECYCLL